MRAQVRSSAAAGLAAAMLATAAFAPPPQSTAPRPVAQEIRLAAAPALGAIPLAFVRNQFEYCSLICPYAVQGLATVPLALVALPATFVGSLVTTGSLTRAIGTAAASVTGPANAAVTPLINNDVYLVVPKAFHALGVTVVEAINVGAAVFTPDQFLQVIQGARTNILGALNQPVGTPTTPTGARNILQVVAVETINVTAAVAFQAGELLLAGVVQTADAAAQELARSGNPGAALAAGAERAGRTVGEAGNLVVTAVDTAVRNVSASLHDPFPSTPRVAKAEPGAESDLSAAPSTRRPRHERAARQNTTAQSSDRNADVSENSDHSAASSTGSSFSTGSGSVSRSGSSRASAVSVRLSDRLSRCCSSDNATPSARKNRMNSGAPR
jgi:hypothetical protein